MCFYLFAILKLTEFKIMKAKEAINIISKIPQYNLIEIRNKISDAINLNRYYVYIGEFDITISEKEILEDDGYFVDTSYTHGFCIRWYEPNKNNFQQILENVQKNGKFKVSDDVIMRYLEIQLFE